MSVEIELKQRLNLQEGDEFTFIKDLYHKYVERKIAYGFTIGSKFSKMMEYVIVNRKNGQMGIYTKDGKVVIPEDDHKCWAEFYDDEGQFHEVIYIQKDELIEVRSYDGKKQIVPKICKRVFLGENFITIRNVYIGVYSYIGKEIVPMKFTLIDKAQQNDCSVFICTNPEGLQGVYSEDGEVIIPFENQKISYKRPFFEVTKANGGYKKELYTFSGEKLPIDNADRFQWIDNEQPYMFTNKRGDNFILAFKDGMREALYTYDGIKIADNLSKYAKMYLEKKYIICIGRDAVTMDVYNFQGEKIAQVEP